MAARKQVDHLLLRAVHNQALLLNRTLLGELTCYKHLYNIKTLNLISHRMYDTHTFLVFVKQCPAESIYWLEIRVPNSFQKKIFMNIKILY